MRVRERVRRDLVPVELAEDAPPGMARAGVHQHVAHQVHVDPVRREPAQHVQAVGEALHPSASYVHPSSATSAGAARRIVALVTCRARPDPSCAPAAPHLPARARRRSRSGSTVKRAPRCQVFPRDSHWNVRVDEPAGRERLGDRSCAASASTARCTPTSAPGCTRGGRSASPTRPCRAASAGCACRSTTRTSPTAGRYPIPRRRADRGRAQLRRRPARDRRGPRPLPAVRAVRRLPAGGRQALARRAPAPSGACARTGSARAAGRRRTPPACRSCPGLARYEEVRRGAIDHALRFTAQRTRRAFVYPARHFASSASDPDLPPMGAARAAARRASTPRASRARPGSCSRR